MTGRTSDDKGEIDGYFGMFNSEVHSNPVDFKKIETPEGKKTTLVVSHNEDGFCWTCKRCGDKLFSDKFSRPLHTCKVAS